MALELILQKAEGKKITEVGRLKGGRTILGRESNGPASLVIQHPALSRQHGVFFNLRSHWFYSDLGSTNGSWVNGKKIEGSEIYLVRPGDIIQFADIVVRLSSEDFQAGRSASGSAAINRGVISLIVLRGSEMVEEFPVPEYGRALVAGGANADLELPGDVAELPSLVIERKGGDIYAIKGPAGGDIGVNGTLITQQQALSDRDVVSLEPYEIIFNDPREVPSRVYDANEFGVEIDHGFKADMEDVSSFLKGWDDEAGRQEEKAGSGEYSKRPSKAYIFGHSEQEKSEETPEHLETIAIDAEEVEERVSDFLSRQKSSIPVFNRPEMTFEDKIMIVVGLLLILFLVATVAWWVFS